MSEAAEDGGLDDREKAGLLVFDLPAREDSLKRIQDLAQDRTLDQSVFLEGIVAEMTVGMGFDRARYYDAAPNLPSVGDSLLVLTHSAGMGETVCDGLRIPLRKTTLGRSGQTQMPAVHSSGAQVDIAERPHLKLLGLDRAGRCWVDMPIRYGDELIAAISCDWIGGDWDLTRQDKDTLELIAGRIGARLSWDLRDGRVGAPLEELPDSGPISPLEGLLRSQTVRLTDGVQGAIGALFEYDWRTGMLQKVAEYAHESLKSEAREFHELYGPAPNNSLTMMAWSDPKFRYVVDFETVERDYPDLIDSKSWTRHGNLFTNHRVTSVLYGLLGHREPRFLLRVMNRADQPHLPFCLRHKIWFEEAAEDLAERLDTELARRRLWHHQAVARHVAEAPRDTETLLGLAAAALKDEGFPTVWVLGRSEGDAYLSFEWASDDLAIAGREKGAMARIENDAFLAELFKLDRATVLTLSRHSSAPSLRTKFDRTSARHAIAFPVVSASATAGSTPATTIVLLPITLPEGANHPSAHEYPRRFPESYGAVETYAYIIGTSVASSRFLLTTDGAREVVANIGHEVATPVAILGNRSLVALYELSRLLPPQDVGANGVIGRHIDEVKHAMRQVDVTLDFAFMGRQQPGSLMQLDFRSHDLFEMLEDAASQVSSQMVYLDQRLQRRRFAFRFMPGCQRLGLVVCDRAMMTRAFVNVFSNAVKYSLPRESDEPISIRVEGNPQTNLAIVTVEDWGLGIRDEEFERIFQLFVKGSNRDTRKAISGIGLGLWAARRILEAHRGSILCLRSEPTLDDWRRSERLEGYTTVFELRLRRDLPEKLVEYSWR